MPEGLYSHEIFAAMYSDLRELRKTFRKGFRLLNEQADSISYEISEMRKMFEEFLRVYKGKD